MPNTDCTPLNRTRVNVHARQDEALRLRNTGMTYADISRALGYGSANGGLGREAVRRAIMAATVRNAAATPTSRRFGVEIEFFGITRNAAAIALQAAGVDAVVEGYNHTTTAHWKIVTDSSVSATGTGSYSGNEIVSPILQGEDGYAAVRLVCKTLTEAGARVGATCGLHVHHDANDLTADEVGRVVEMYAVNQNHINGLVSRSRRGSRWARNWSQYDIADLKAEIACGTDLKRKSWDRYKTVNMDAYRKYGTLEFRQHQGTLSGDKIVAWVRFGQTMIEAARTMSTMDAANDLDGLLDVLVEAGLEQNVRDYLKRRAAAMAR